MRRGPFKEDDGGFLSGLWWAERILRFEPGCSQEKSETYHSLHESCSTFEVDEPLALALSLLAHQLDEDIVESGGGHDVSSGHGHVIGKHISLRKDLGKNVVNRSQTAGKEFCYWDFCKMGELTFTLPLLLRLQDQSPCLYSYAGVSQECRRWAAPVTKC